MELEVLVPEPGSRRAGWRDYIRARAVNDSGQTDVNLPRQANHAALVQVAARGLANEDPMTLIDNITSELSHLADAILECAFECVQAEVPGSSSMRIVMVTMRKARAEELNYASGVDVIYITEPVEGVDHEEVVRVGARAVAAMTRICSARTPEGTVRPIGAALRPEGSAGPLMRSLASCATCYGKWTKNRESQTLLKARLATRDREPRQAFCNMVPPLMREVAQRPGFLLDVCTTRNWVISLIPAKETDREIKLGIGGLRDTEFTVRLLQLVHGRGDGRARAHGTFEALRVLVTFGHIGRGDGVDMARAYRVQQMLEHRVRLCRSHRAHLMSDDESGWVYLARTTGRTPDEIRDTWHGSTRAVEKLQQHILFSPLLGAVSAIPTAEPRLSTDTVQGRLRVLDFEGAHTALGHIQALTNGSTRAVEVQRQLMSAALGWLAENLNPDHDLFAFRQLSKALGTSSWYLRALRDEG